MSKQDAARMLRYQFLIKTSKLEYCQRIATGHTADDQAETVLLRLLRGAGPDGLGGIPERSADGWIVRPLLRVTRAEIEAYARRHGIGHIFTTTAVSFEDLVLRQMRSQGVLR